MRHHLLPYTMICSLTLTILGIYYAFTPPPINTWDNFLTFWFSVSILVTFLILLFTNIAENSITKNSLRQCINLLTTAPIGIVGGLILLSGCISTIAILTGFRHDYIAYIQQWSVILQGDDPWNPVQKIPTNAYGPLFNVLALFYAIHPLAPKLLFCISSLGASTWLIKILGNRYRKEPLIMLAGLLFLFINPFLLLTIAEQGLFDILPAITILSAIVLRTRRYFLSSGLVLGIGVLFKYYPIVLLPFLMIDQRRVKLSPLLSCFGIVSSGFTISCSIWGMSTFSPIFLATERASKQISIFRFLRGRFSPLHLLTDSPNLDKYSIYATVVFILLVIFLSWLRNIETSLAGMIGMLTALTFYKVGHLQFYTCLFLMMPFWYTTSVLPETRKLKILFSNGIFLMWIASLQLAYSLSGLREPPWLYLRDIVGLPSFLLAGWAIITAIHYGTLMTSLTDTQ